jgi:HPt (histidine-containing phosphotransfer) domain-containing protein
MGRQHDAPGDGTMTTARSRSTVVEIRKVMEPLIPEFIEHRHHDVARLVEAIDRTDHESVRAIGHNLKGLGATYGFQVITNLGSALEQNARREDTQGIKDTVTMLSDYLDRVDVVFV